MELQGCIARCAQGLFLTYVPVFMLFLSFDE